MPRFLRRLRAVGVRLGSPSSAAVSATIAALAEAGQLPGVLDAVASIPPTRRACVRRVAGRNFWIWYRATNGELLVLNITNAPPVPIDE